MHGFDKDVKPEGKIKRMPLYRNEGNSVANTAAMMEGSKAMGIARAKQDLAAKAVKGNKKRKNRPIGPIIL